MFDIEDGVPCAKRACRGDKKGLVRCAATDASCLHPYFSALQVKEFEKCRETRDVEC